MEQAKNIRQSNFELLRIVAMIFIVTHHLITKGADTCGYMTTYNYNKDGCLGLFVNGFIVGGVNLFVLISGYFGIKNLIKPLLKMFVDLTVYGIIAYLIGVTFLGINFSIKGLIHGIDIHNWFVIHFALLVLSAPILEAALKGKDEKTVGKWVILLLIVNVIFGFLLGYVNDNGYNYLNFILLYIIARYIRLIKEKQTILYVHIRKFGIIYWIMSAMLLAIGFLALYKLGKMPSSIRYFAYNNPLVLFSTFCIFVVFSSLKFQSKYVNIIATGMFGVFLMHTPPEIIPLRNKISSSIFLQYGYLGIFVEVSILFAILTIIAIPTERQNRLISKTLHNSFKKFCLNMANR